MDETQIIQYEEMLRKAMLSSEVKVSSFMMILSL